MKLHIFVLIFAITGLQACWSKSKVKTTTTTTLSPIEEEIVASGSSSNSRAYDSSRSGGHYQGGSNNPSSSRSNVETAALRSLSEELYQLDSNSVGSLLSLNYQGHTSPQAKNDAAPSPLFSRVGPDALKGNTIAAFEKLLNNYIADVNAIEDNSGAEKMEVNSFLDAIMSTPVMQKTEQFLKQNGLIQGALRPELQLIWFTPYSRSRNILGSSGFEHVFLGEIKKGKVTGFHNWVFFHKEELENDINYKGYMKSIDLGNKGKILKMRFDWLYKPKAIGSMFIGTSPELEMALYTVCFYARPNKGCNLQMNRNRFRIKVYKQHYQGNQLIGSAFPEVF